jgi:4-hydroxy-2-oxoheptanedioate aldolase
VSVAPTQRKWPFEHAPEPSIGASVSVPDPFVAEVMAQAGFDWLFVDLQHGLVDPSDLANLVHIIVRAGVMPVVRVPNNDESVIGRCLDAGARAIIVPMVESADDVRAALSACLYPPAGKRSYGTKWVEFLYGADYFARADEYVACYPMIETPLAVDHLEEILDVEGIAGLFVGPSDLGISMGHGPLVAYGDPMARHALSDVFTAVIDGCARRGLASGVGSSASHAAVRRHEGFDFISIGTEFGFLTAGAKASLQQARQRFVG